MATAYRLTKEQIKSEIVKCAKDPIYFLNTYARISDTQKGPIPFRTFEFQDEVLKDMKDYRFNVVLKARQLGLSTIVAGYIAWLMLFHRDKNVLILATKLLSAANMVKKVKYIIKSLPEWLMIADVSIDNRNSFELTNGSQIKASATSGDAGRSEALSLLVLDEAAFIENMKDLWTGVYPTLATGGRCIAISTPNGVGNWFHQTYLDAETGTNEFHPIKLHWSVHPDRDQAWFERETKNMSKREIAQEYECSFNASGETVIGAEELEQIEKNCSEPKIRTYIDRNLWIWKEYNPNHSYVLVADTARGDGKDNSVFHLLNLDTMEIIAEYQGKITTEDFAELVVNTGKEYGNCMVVVENNNLGFSVLEKIVDKGYPNVYFSTKGSAEFVDQVTAEGTTNTVPGFTTSHKSRPLIVAKMEEFIRNKSIKINSIRTFHELSTFIWTFGRPQAMQGYNDDLVMSLAIACWVKDTVFQTNQRELEYKKAMLTGFTKSNTMFDTKIPGMQGYNRDLSVSIQKAKQEYEQYFWIYKG
jgi:hypothetical protein